MLPKWATAAMVRRQSLCGAPRKGAPRATRQSGATDRRGGFASGHLTRDPAGQAGATTGGGVCRPRLDAHYAGTSPGRNNEGRSGGP